MILLHTLTGNEGEFVKEYKPTGKPLTTQIKLSNGDIYFAPSTEFISKEVKKSMQNYRKVGIDFEVENDVVKVYQKKLVNGYILNQKELYDRAKELFPNSKIQPVVFSLDVSIIDEKWIENKMEEYGIKRNDLIKQLALDKSYISLLFADENSPRKINLSKPMKAMFYYYFLTYELNRDFREYLSQKDNRSDLEKLKSKIDENSTHYST